MSIYSNLVKEVFLVEERDPIHAGNDTGSTYLPQAMGIMLDPALARPTACQSQSAGNYRSSRFCDRTLQIWKITR